MCKSGLLVNSPNLARHVNFYLSNKQSVTVRLQDPVKANIGLCDGRLIVSLEFNCPFQAPWHVTQGSYMLYCP